ncbi:MULTISPECIES: hypothetical protein [Halomonadaceae]|uniref:Uncharacterized protein n=2 Tax=Halomonadaceae TaxID=28256 RepID=A0A2A2F2X4_9GAMM|nr:MULTISPECIES: hypothetical protein [Halomonas]MDR5906172.1 hypothetical protein [Halomonas qiaohouensis]PAU78952.1 hypothetical protein CK498_00815 [Halomonas salipaludis]
MDAFWTLLAMSAAFGAFTGSLFRLSRRPGYQRPFLFPLVGLLAGITAFFIYRILLAVTGAPVWLVPLLVVLQVWLWLGPLAPRFTQANGNSK